MTEGLGDNPKSGIVIDASAFDKYGHYLSKEGLLVSNRQMKEIHCTDGLHRIKKSFQKKYMGKQCNQLRSCLTKAIDCTIERAPVRRNKYLSMRNQNARMPASPEGKLERELYSRWHESECDLAGCWRTLVSYQVNLPDERHQKEPWGEIDLLGIGKDNLPVVVELKQANSAETLPGFLFRRQPMEFAIQKAWPERLRAEWKPSRRESVFLFP